MCAVGVLLLDYFTPHFSMHINFTAFFIHMIETLAAKQQQMRELGKESAKLDVFQIAEYKKLRQTASM
ncbi:MAG: hypothetical protein BJ554DRAFT_7866, partial [Olpidium bornovanus]